jgi:hypothetical protein
LQFPLHKGPKEGTAITRNHGFSITAPFVASFSQRPNLKA